MSLFSYAKSMGRKLFSKKEDAPQKIQQHIEADNPGIEGLKVEYNEGVVNISGKAKSSEALEKAVLMAGNVAGVEQVTIEGIESPPLSENVEYYEIAQGDTLWALAKKFYGNGSKYTQIFEANKEVIQDPDKIFVGQKIRIPKGE